MNGNTAAAGALARVVDEVLEEEYGSRLALAAEFHRTLSDMEYLLEKVVRHGPPIGMDALKKVVRKVVAESYREYLDSLDVQDLALRLQQRSGSAAARQQLRALLGDADT